MFKILTASVLCSAIMRHHSKFCADWSNRYGYMAVFQFFKMAAVCHLGFLKVGNFKCPYPSGAKMHYSAKFCANRSTVPGTIPNFVQIGRNVAEIWPFFDFLRWRLSVKVGNFNCPYSMEGQNALPCQILCRLVELLRYMAVFRFFKMAADRHLGFIKNGRHRGSPTWLPREIGI